jgi:rhamnogalacturonan endolyase
MGEVAGNKINCGQRLGRWVISPVLWLSCAASLAACLIVARCGNATPMVTDNASAITVANDHVSFTIAKTGSAAAELRSLTLDGVNLMSSGSSRGYFSANRGPIGGSQSYWELGQGTTNISYTTGPDYVDVAMYHPAEATTPYDITQHYVLRDGESGFHTYAQLHHPDAMPDYYIEELRYLIRADPTKFTHHWVSPTRHDVMPLPSDLGTSVQDATQQVPIGSAYNLETGKDIYTKYDYSIGTDEVGVYGFYDSGSAGTPGYGMWLVQPNKESWLGGPTKQELTVHQTTSTPALIGMLVGQHYNGQVQLETPGEFSRGYGPFYVHLNRGTDAEAMYEDAASYYDPSYHQAFYDSLGIDGWVSAADRSHVQGQFHFVSGGAAEGAYVILYDNSSINSNDDFQFSRYGYQYWSRVAADGSFDLANVRPGTYRFAAYAPGTYGEYHQGEVTVGNGTTLTLDPIVWQPPDHGADIWQIGNFDRTATEFLHGSNDEFRRYGMWEQYDSDFPDDVNFVVGQSDEATDWNYMHWENVANHGSPDWNILFDLGELPDDHTATLTIAVTGQEGSNLRIRVNGTTVFSNWDLPLEGSVGHRSGMVGVYQSREFTFSTSLLVAGTNTITLDHASPGSTSVESPRKDGIVYDALRLEIDLLPGDYNYDGVVDAADYTVWRNSLGSSESLAADGNFDGVVDGLDYDTWKQNFGKSLPTGSAANSAGNSVPEPATFVIALLATAIATVPSRRKE